MTFDPELGPTIADSTELNITTNVMPAGHGVAIAARAVDEIVQRSVDRPLADAACFATRLCELRRNADTQ